MRKGHSIIGLNVISQSDGDTLGKVRDLVFDRDSDRLVALVLTDREIMGLVKAHIVPWEEVAVLGPDAVMVRDHQADVVADQRPEIRRLMDGDSALAGTRLYTTDGRDLGTVTDLYVDESSGRVVGYEVSGGLVADTVSGKRFLPYAEGLKLGEDVALVPPAAAQEIEDRMRQEPGGLRGVAASASGRIGEAVDSARSRASALYENIAEASAERQKEFVVGKTAARDVPIPAAPAEGAAETILVSKGERITREQAERAEAAGRLSQLVLAAGGGVMGEAWSSGKERLGSLTASGTASTAEAVVGRTAGREVVLPNGSTLIAPGMVITRDTLEQARLHGRERELIASAGLGMAGQGVQATREKAGSLWETLKEKAAELADAVQGKRTESQQRSLQNRINRALGRPVTRVILDPADNVLLNTGELITHAAIERARAAGVLDVLLDSVFEGPPEISPDMMRAPTRGEAALENVEGREPSLSPPPDRSTPGSRPAMR